MTKSTKEKTKKVVAWVVLFHVLPILIAFIAFAGGSTFVGAVMAGYTIGSITAMSIGTVIWAIGVCFG